MAAGMLSKGLKKGDKIGIISNNRPEWNFIDLAAHQIGVVTVPIYTKISREEVKYIAKDARIKLLFIENEEIYGTLRPMISKISFVEGVYSFDDINEIEKWPSLKEDADQNKITEHRGNISPDDVASLVYTSGTTGKPKGVMLTHNNIISNVKACLPLMPVDEKNIALSFLPLNHVFERMLNYLYIAGGISIYYAESVEKIGDNLKEVKPHIFATVPRLLEKIYEKIVDTGKNLSGIKRGIFFWALKLAQQYGLQGKSWFYKQQLKVADKLVFREWRAAVGGNVVAIISGGAALNERVNRVFHAAGLPVMEGYGLTETSPVIAVNRFEERYRKIGTVGPPLENVQVKIAEDGEILCKGPNVMKGYYNLKEKTEEVLKDGWFHTEDMGQIKDGFLKITDRKKHMFKTSGGKYVAPQNIENVMNESYLISQIMAVGEGRKMVTALVVPDFDNLKKWCGKNGISWSDRNKMVQNKNVLNKYQQVIDKKNAKLNHTEQIKKFVLLADEWTEQTGELTPTLKIKRKIVEDKYQEQLHGLYEPKSEEAVLVN